MTSKLNLSYLDFEGKTGSVATYADDFTAGNFVAINALLDTLVAAISAVTLMPLTQDQRIASIEAFAVPLPSDPNAQRGVKWLVRARETVTGNAVTFRIPGADLTLLTTNSEKMDITAGAGLALVNAIEAVVRSNDGGTIEVVEIVYLD